MVTFDSGTHVRSTLALPQLRRTVIKVEYLEVLKYFKKLIILFFYSIKKYAQSFLLLTGQERSLSQDNCNFCKVIVFVFVFVEQLFMPDAG